MKTKFWFALSMSLLVCIGATAKPAAKKPLKPASAAQMKTFNALYAKSDAATLRGDTNYLNSILAPNFSSRSLSGRTSNRVQRMRNISRMMRQIKFTAATSSVEKLGFRGKQAFVVVSGSSEFEMRNPKGKMQRIRITTISNDSWISTKRGWLYQSSVETSGRVFVDGREVEPPRPS